MASAGDMLSRVSALMDRYEWMFARFNPAGRLASRRVFFFVNERGD
jgi:hypothetical protein